MLEKITFVSERDLTGCTLLNPKFMEVCRKIYEYNDSKNLVKVPYLHLIFDKGDFDIYDGTEVGIEAVVDGEVITYSGSNKLRDYFAFIIALFPSLDVPVSIPANILVLGDSSVELPTTEVATISAEVTQDLADYLEDALNNLGENESVLVTVSWGEANTGVYSLKEVVETTVYLENLSGNAINEDTAEAYLMFQMYSGVITGEVVENEGNLSVENITGADLSQDLHANVVRLAWVEESVNKSARYYIEDISEDRILLGSKVAGDDISGAIAEVTLGFNVEFESGVEYNFAGFVIPYSVIIIDQLGKEVDYPVSVTIEEALPDGIEIVYEEGGFSLIFNNLCSGAGTDIVLTCTVNGLSPTLRAAKTVSLLS